MEKIKCFLCGRGVFFAASNPFAKAMIKATISRYENMEREADYESLIKFADYFDVSLDYLLGRDDNK